MQLMIIENLEVKSQTGGIEILHYLLKDEDEHSD
jgi:hypothetical protein